MAELIDVDRCCTFLPTASSRAGKSAKRELKRQADCKLSKVGIDRHERLSTSSISDITGSADQHRRSVQFGRHLRMANSIKRSA